MRPNLIEAKAIRIESDHLNCRGFWLVRSSRSTKCFGAHPRHHSSNENLAIELHTSITRRRPFYMMQDPLERKHKEIIRKMERREIPTWYIYLVPLAQANTEAKLIRACMESPALCTAQFE
jgi:hypothetical protein